MFVHQLPILELRYIDASGSKGTVMTRAPLGTTYAEMDASAITLASIIAPLTGCVLIEQRINFKAVAVPKPEATGSSPSIRRGVFYFQNDDEDTYALVEIPGLVSDVLFTVGPSAGVEIDITNADVVAFASAAIDLPLTDPFGVEMASIVIAYLQSRVT